MSKIALSLRALSKWYQQGPTRLQVLKNLEITFEKGTSYALAGISGSGKSTLIGLLAGLDKPTSGTISFNGENISHFNENEKVRFLNKSLGLVFQFPYLIKELTIIENVMIKGLIAGFCQRECRQKAQVLLEQVDLLHKIYAFPGQLSGGQQQRVALARALMNQPDFLLADEPTGNLDLHTGKMMVDLILQLQQEWGMGVIISSHDEYVSKKMEKVYELKDGLLLLQS